MRRFELVLAFGCAFAVLWPAIFGVRSRRGIIAVTLLGLIALQLRAEGYRWQLLPLYLTATGLAVGDVIFIERRLVWYRRAARGVFGSIGVALVALPGLALPVPSLPTPSGPEVIGSITVEVISLEREESYGPNPGGPRRIVAQVWYPAVDDSEVEFDLWHPAVEEMAPALSRRLGLPGFFLNHLRYVPSHSKAGLPIRAGRFPIVVYSHGWTGFRTIALNQIEALVSNGYMVIAIDHTYGSLLTVDSEGASVPYDPLALPDPATVTAQQYAASASALVEVFSDDQIAVLDALEMGADGPFAAVFEHTDTTRIGIYGHSVGGGAAVRTCLLDDRCDAVVGMDPWVEPLADRVIAITAAKPMLFMRSDDWRGNTNDAILRGLAARGEATNYLVGIDGAGHNDLVATPLLTPLADDFGLRGSIGAGRVLLIVERHLVGFFDHTLLGTGAAAIQTSSFSEVVVEVIEP